MSKELSSHRIIVTGGLGMLAGDLIPELTRERAEFVVTDIRPGARDEYEIHSLDITDLRAVREFVSEYRPTWIINCAAYTAVDEAEKNQELAFSVNATGPANLAKAAREAKAQLLHISTDYVFGGGPSADSQKPYGEDDPVTPCGIYGQSKRFGDELVSSILPYQSLIVRTSWLHGVHGPNFVNTILRVAKEKPELKVVDDQIGSPTWARWLANVLIRLVKRDVKGTVHATSKGNISWYEFALKIVEEAKLPIKISPQTTKELGRPAPRPAFSTLDVSKLEKILGEPCPSWTEGLRAHLQALGVVQ